MKPDFSGWATRNDLRCSDGRTIRKNAFKHQDGQTVPLMWGHKHDDPADVLGHAVLENRDEGLYAYCYLNDSAAGQAAKEVVQHGDVRSLSIYANHLKQVGQDVIHGIIREVSLVLAGANPGAFIDSVMAHGDGEESGIIIGYDENVMLWHSDDPPKKSEGEKKEEGKPSEKPDEEGEDKKPSEKPDDEKTVREVIESFTDIQRGVVDYMISQALQEDPGEWEDSEDPEDPEDEDDDNSKGGDKTMKHNAFDKDTQQEKTTLSHSDMKDIIALAKQNSVGSLRTAFNIYIEQMGAEGNDTLQHGIDDIESLFPDYKDLRPGAPELVSRDQGWVDVVMAKVHKSPISRIRTRQMDARNKAARGQGYQKGKMKKPAGNMTLISRTTDPQTVYCIDALNRDDIVDITDFDVVEYQYGVMRQNLNEEVATAIMIGDGREEGEEMKISESHIRSIWNDDDLYTIHYDLDIEAARNELQGSRTDMNFGENFIYAEAIVNAALYSREKYKGTGTPDFFCTPHLLNVMLLARDMNGHRLYASKAELAAALNVGEIYTAEQFEGLIRQDSGSAKHKLLGIIVNLADYTVGSTKGGEITRFDQFDIDFNQHKYLIETRLSGALARVYSAIALEEPISA